MSILTMAVCVAVCLGPAAGVCRAAAEHEDFTELTQAWRRMRRAPVGAREFIDARGKLVRLIVSLPAGRRSAAAASLMDRCADDSVNTAAVELFGQDPFAARDIRRLLFDAKRSYGQRVLLRICYSLCRAERGSSVISKDLRRQMVGLLADRLDTLAGNPLHYGEQRLLIHLCASVLSRYAHSSNVVPQVEKFLTGLRKYVAKCDDRQDSLAASIRGWMILRTMQEGQGSTVQGALASLGHWDPLARVRAAGRLAAHANQNDKVIAGVLEQLGDPRDEVRAAALRVFAFTREGPADRIIASAVKALIRDRGVVVQAAAAEVIAARAEQASGAIAPLLNAFGARVRPGQKRTASILLALSYLAGRAGESQKRQILALARRKLSAAPRAALSALKALGPAARPAVGAIREYHGNADRFLRKEIDEHVLPAITGRPAGG